MGYRLRTLMRSSLLMRNWATFSNYPAILQNAIQNYTTSYQDSVKLLKLRGFDKNEEISSDKSHNVLYINILQNIKIDSKFMDRKLALDILMALFKLSKTDKDVEYIKNQQEFHYLCKVINHNIRDYPISDIISILKVLTYMKVSSKSALLQKIFQILRVSINDIVLEQIPFTYFLLAQNEKIPLVEALLIALPLVFQNQLKTKYYTQNINLLVKALTFCRTACTINEVNMITDMLLANTSKIDVKNAKAIHHNIALLNTLPNSSLNLLQAIQKLLVAKEQNLSFTDISMILYDIVIKVSNREDAFYNEHLIDTLCYAALALNPTFAEGISILKSLNVINYSNICLLDYLAAKCFEDRSTLNNCSYNEMNYFTRGFVIADYKPVFWDIIQETILSGHIDTDISNLKLLTLALNLAALDCYHPDILRRSFNIDVGSIPEILRTKELSRLLLLYQSVATLYPKHKDIMPDKNILKEARPPNALYNTRSLEESLISALGGSQFITSNLRTKLEHFIDHMVVIQLDGHPVNLRNSNIPLHNNNYCFEEMPLPPNSVKILIFNFPQQAYCMNSQRLKSTWLLILRSVEALTKCCTIAINSGVINKLPDYEKILYIKQSLKLKCDNIIFAESNLPT